MRNDWEFGPRRPAPLWQSHGDSGDPSLIILRNPETTVPKAPIPSMPEDARHRALLRAGFRSQAENLLTASLGRLPEGEIPEGKVVAQALDDARRTIGSVDEEAERETRGALDGMMAAIRTTALRRAETLRSERALDALEAEADDLVAQVRRDPDRHDAYGGLLDQATERYAQGLESQELSAFRSNLAREARQAQVLGLIDQERFDDARAVMDACAPLFPDGQGAWLVRMITEAKRSAGDRAGALRLSTMEEAVQELATSDAVETTTGVALDNLSPPDRRRLAALRQGIETRKAANDMRVSVASEAAAGHGWVPSLPVGERPLAAELYWQRIGRSVVEALDEKRRPDAVASIVGSLETVPMALRGRIRFGLAPGAEPAKRLETARWLTTLLRREPWSMAAFTDDERRYADYVVQALEAGIYEGREDQAIAWADRHVPLRRPPASVGEEETEAVRQAALSGFGPFTAVRRALEGGLSLDPHSEDDQLLGAIYWREVNRRAWHEVAPAAAAQQATDFVVSTRILPTTLLADLHAGLASNDPDAAERAARTVAGLVDALPETLDRFDANALERANLINQAVMAGSSAEEALRFANKDYPLPRPVDPVASGMAREAIGASWIAANPEVSDPRSSDGLKEIKANQDRILQREEASPESE